MRKNRIIIAVVLLAAVIGIFFAVRKYNVKRQIENFLKEFTFKEEFKDEVGLINPDEVVEIKFRNPSGAMTFEKTMNGEWYMTEPERAPANTLTFSDMALHLAGLKQDNIVEENPSDLSKYNLDNPDISVQFRLRGAEEWNFLDFGRRTPTGAGYYAYNRQRKTVFVVDFTLKFDFNGRYFDYLNKDTFSRNVIKANRLLLRFTDVTYEFVLPEGGNYWITKQPANMGKVRPRAVEAILFFLGGLELQGMFGKDVSLQQLGLDNPPIEITVTRTGEWEESLVIGNEIRPGIRSAKKVGAEGLFTIKEEMIQQLKEGAGNQSPEMAVWFPWNDVKKMEFTGKGDSFIIFRESMEGKWMLEGRSDAQIDHGAVMDLIFKIRNTRNRGYIGASVEEDAARYGLDKPRMAVSMEFFHHEKIKPLTIYYGKPDPSGKFLYSYNSEDPYILMMDREVENILPGSPKPLLK